MSKFIVTPTPPEVVEFQRQWPSLSADLRRRRTDWLRAFTWIGIALALLAFWGTVLGLIVAGLQ